MLLYSLCYCILVLLCCSLLFILLCSCYVCVLDCIYFTLTLPPGVNPIAVNKYLSKLPTGTMCPGVDSASKIECQKAPGGKDGRCVRVTTLPPSLCRKSRKSGGLTYRTPKGLLKPVAGKLYHLRTLLSLCGFRLMYSTGQVRQIPLTIFRVSKYNGTFHKIRGVHRLRTWSFTPMPLYMSYCRP